MMVLLRSNNTNGSALCGCLAAPQRLCHYYTEESEAGTSGQNSEKIEKIAEVFL